MNAQYIVTDREGHFGDFARVYSAHSTADAARRAIGSLGTLLVVAKCSGKAKGDRIHRADYAALQIVGA